MTHSPDTPPLTASKAWQQLARHAEGHRDIDLNGLFGQDPDRAGRYTLETDRLSIDFSRQKVTQETLTLLYQLAEQQQVGQCIRELLSGVKINTTEDRAALHTALRSDNGSLIVDNINVMDGVRAGLSRMAEIVTALHEGRLRGWTGKKFRTVINIGIGGSDLGPRLAAMALHSYCRDDIDVHFVANIDYQDLHASLGSADPETTLFIVASKSFTTLETLTNARSARQWLAEHQCMEPARHFIAVTTNQAAALEFGVDPGNILEFSDWVGGRYSLWSTIGLPVAIAIGMDKFDELLHGARTMDEHIATAPLQENIPATLALIDVWNANFLGAETLAVIPYDHALSLLPDYLSQLLMESNGKNVTRQGQPVDYDTGLIVWGAAGTNGQHAFFQLLHQGTRNIPVEFLVAVNPNVDNADHHEKLVANCIAQGEALMTGKPDNSAEPHRNFPGNRQSTTIMFDRLTPAVLGELLALYEHRTFVQACIWDINAFDQWGVELGKVLAGTIMQEFESGRASGDHDAATYRLIERYLKYRN